jgi:calcium-dependent protein kinase
MGCIQPGKRTIIKTNKLLESEKKPSGEIKELAVTQSSPTNKKISTLKELSRLANISKDIKIKNLITLINSKPEDNYKIISKLGKGSFGSVFKVKNKNTGEIRAMKIIKNTSVKDNDGTANQKFLKEIQVLKGLEHPNIIKIFEYYIDNKYHYIITELLTGGELYEAILKCQKFNEKKAAYIMKQILSALNYLHSKNIVHRDIKPENILVQNDPKKNKNYLDEIHIKLIDFGASNFFKENEILTLKVGSPYYIAPEVLNKSYNEKCDIWSAGVVLYVMLTGNFPFVGKTSQKLFENIKSGKYKNTGKEWEAISPQAKDLIKKMLELDTTKRISALECLNSQFITSMNSKESVPDILPSVLKNIYKLNAREKIQQATIALIVHNIQQNDQVEKLKGIFELLDLNKDGQLTYSEIQKAFKQIFPDNYITDDKMKIILDKMDDNKDGVISYEEFLRVTLDEKILLEKNNLKLAFDKFDLNKDGKLSKEELLNILDKGASDYVDDLLDLIDKNKDGYISFDEFCHLMNKVNG